MKIKCERSSAEAKMILFHEIGHYVNNDYLHFDSQSEEFAKECRLYAANNALLDLEIAADAFAAKDLVNDTVSTEFLFCWRAYSLCTIATDLTQKM